MKINGPYGLIKRPSHSILCITKKEKEALVNYLNEFYEEYEIKTEKIEVIEEYKKEYGDYVWYYEITGPLGLNLEKINKWYNKNKGGENNMHETIN